MYAVCYHIGTTLDSGHYMASCKIDNQWYLFDDETVYEMEECQLERPKGPVDSAYHTYDLDAYLLFYTQT